LESIQLFPPGQHDVIVTNAKGEPVPLSVAITEATAATLEAVRARYQAESDAGTGDAPYLDLNHDDREASAWVKAIHWAGEDPQTGGVRATVELTDAGRAAITGRTYRRVSPSFHADKDGKITGAPANMGGFVNRAAFRTIAPLFAKETTHDTTTMTPDEITALQAENTALKTELETLRTELTAMQKTDAEALVASAVKDGRLAGDETLQAKWVSSLLASPDSKTLLASLPVNPLLQAKLPAQKRESQAADTDTPAETPEVLLAKFEALPRDEKNAFFATHRAALTSLRR
jgi:L-amino acid N-acyltransferase YncA